MTNPPHKGDLPDDLGDVIAIDGEAIGCTRISMALSNFQWGVDAKLMGFFVAGGGLVAGLSLKL